MNKSNYENYYKNLAKNEYIIKALNDDTAKHNLKIWEAKLFYVIFRRYIKSKNLFVLKLYFFILYKVFTLKRGIK